MPNDAAPIDSPAVLAVISARKTYEALVTADHCGVLSPPLAWSLVAQQLRMAVRGLEGEVTGSLLLTLTDRAKDADARALYCARILRAAKRVDAQADVVS